MTELQKIDLDLRGVELSKVALGIKSGISFSDWEAIVATLSNVEGALQWWIGDALNFGEDKFGEAYAQAVDPEKVGYSNKTLSNLKYVAGAIPASRRRENVAWSKHAEVASLPEEAQEKILDRAESLSVKQVREIVRDAKGGDREEPELCEKCGRPLPKELK